MQTLAPSHQLSSTLIHSCSCISNVCDWTTPSKFKMNDDKTEYMLFGTRQQLAKVSVDKTTVGENSIPLLKLSKIWEL